jgi:hypothetical protein
MRDRVEYLLASDDFTSAIGVMLPYIQKYGPSALEWLGSKLKTNSNLTTEKGSYHEIDTDTILQTLLPLSTTSLASVGSTVASKSVFTRTFTASSGNEGSLLVVIPADNNYVGSGPNFLARWLPSSGKFGNGESITTNTWLRSDDVVECRLTGMRVTIDLTVPTLEN